MKPEVVTREDALHQYYYEQTLQRLDRLIELLEPTEKPVATKKRAKADVQD